jgi:hypothetical protein
MSANREEEDYNDFLSENSNSETKEDDEIEEGQWGGEENQVVYSDISITPLLLRASDNYLNLSTQIGRAHV